MKAKYCVITNDVETTSLWNHCLSDKTGETVLKEGMPALLEAYKKFNAKATFYFTGHIAELYPEIVRMIIPYGHEVACHGLVHDSHQAFDLLTSEQQLDHLRRSKEILENICQQEVISFRAPALRINRFTPEALARAGFLIDSSISPQRIDMFLSFGSMKKLRWLTAPRTPYFTSPYNLARKGDGPIFEIPINSFLLPFSGTSMRIAPIITRVVRFMLSLEAAKTDRPVVFSIHPNELINELVEHAKIERRAKNIFKYLLADKLRYHLKLRNLGKKAMPLLLNQLHYLNDRHFSFITIKNYYDLVRSAR